MSTRRPEGGEQDITEGPTPETREADRARRRDEDITEGPTPEVREAEEAEKDRNG
jgi:hypothetical protein